MSGDLLEVWNFLVMEEVVGFLTGDLVDILATGGSAYMMTCWELGLGLPS